MSALFGSVADDFNDSADDTFTGSAKMTPDFRKNPYLHSVGF